MGEIIGCKFDHGIKYLVNDSKNEDETEKWMSGDQIKNKVLINEYWKKENSQMEKILKEDMKARVLKIPESITMMQKRDDGTYFLTKFKDFQIPIVVPYQTLINMNQSLVTHFLETMIYDPEKNVYIPPTRKETAPPEKENTEGSSFRVGIKVPLCLLGDDI